MAVQDSTQRFSSRVENYVRYRPGYPPAVLELLKNDCGLTPASVIADIAFGTGIFTRMLLENGNRCSAWNRIADMRKAGEEFLRDLSAFHQRRRNRGSDDSGRSQCGLCHRGPGGALVRSREGATRIRSHLPARRLDRAAVERAAHRIHAVSPRL